jgi:hypothetical protein
VGASPELAPIWMAYLIGQLGNWLPVPGGIGGTELGLVGALVLYGLPALTATAAVLLYRVIELWIPAVLGLAAFVQLRLLLRRETEAIKLCNPGDTIEIVGLGPATIDRADVKSTATAARAPAGEDGDDIPTSADSERDARERSTANPDAASASQRSDVASTRAAAAPPESRCRSRTDEAARVARATHTCGSTKAGLDQPRPTAALLASSATLLLAR